MPRHSAGGSANTKSLRFKGAKVLCARAGRRGASTKNSRLRNAVRNLGCHTAGCGDAKRTDRVQVKKRMEF